MPSLTRPLQLRFAPSTRTRQALIATAVALALLTATLAALWRAGKIQSWVRAKVVEYYLHEIQPHLPFTIESVEVDATWRQILSGQASKLSATIRWDDWRIRLSGPVHVARNASSGKALTLAYSPNATIEPTRTLGLPAPEKDRSSPLPLQLDVSAHFSLLKPGDTKLAQIELKTEPAQWSWPYLNLEANSPRLRAHWSAEKSQSEASLRFKSFTWTPPQGDRAISLTETSIEADAQLALQPFKLGPTSNARVRTQSAEVLWGETYLDLALQRFPVEAQLTLDERLEPQKIQAAVGISDPAAPEKRALQIQAMRQAKNWQAQWKSAPLALQDLLQAGLGLASSPTGPLAPLSELKTQLEGLEFRSGTLTTQGNATFKDLASAPSIQGEAEIQNAAFQWRKKALAARGVNSMLSFSPTQAHASIQAKELYFKHFKAALDSTRIAYSAKDRHLSIQDGRGQLPLKIDGIPLRIGAIEGKLTDDGPDLRTSLSLPRTPITQITTPMCPGTTRIPPAVVSAELPKIKLTSSDFNPDGEVDVELFGGHAKFTEFGFFDFGKDVPEIDFDLDFEGIQLRPLGDWLGFGEMIGTLEGYAYNVVLRESIPGKFDFTQFDFSIDAKPIKNWIEFDPEALKNIVNLFANNSTDQIPGVAKEAFFGWVSRRLGGYDVKYAGFSLYSQDGSILLETHDPPDIYQVMKKRYLFWGHRFQMPLNSNEYPLVIDAPAMGIYIHAMASYLETLSKQKVEKDKASLETEENPTNAKDETDPLCLPPVF